jgi:hypothetical protein
LRKYGARIDDWKTPLDSAYRVLMSIESGSLFAEKLLTKRYGLLSDIWGARLEIARLNRRREELRVKLSELDRHYFKTFPRPHDAGGERRRGAPYEVRFPLIRTRWDLRFLVKQLERLIVAKRDELVPIEKQLRRHYSIMGRSIASVSYSDLMAARQISTTNTTKPRFRYDLFVSYAAEDKSDVTGPLVRWLIALGLKVWYDESALMIGDSLRRSIDAGLVNSRFGVVIISPSFLRKRWTAYEFDSLVARELEADKVILPIWHNVSKDEVLRFSPKLADKLALHTSIATLEEIALNIALVVSGAQNDS